MTSPHPSPVSLGIRAAGQTHQGLVRRQNQDRLLMAALGPGRPGMVNLPDPDVSEGPVPFPPEQAAGGPGVPGAQESPGETLLLVADGMGGALGGAEAARIAASALHQALGAARSAPDPDPPAQALFQAAQVAHREIRRRGNGDPRLHGMGTTLTAALIHREELHLLQVGDSRALLLRGEILTQLTRDQSMVQEMLDSGVLTPEQARASPHRNVILQALGVEGPLEPVGGRHPLERGDRLLLCSDGLSGVVPAERIREILAKGDPPAPTCEALVREALRGGAPDNVTCIVADAGQARPRVSPRPSGRGPGPRP